MEERERMETVPMGNGSKEELFEKGHPVIRELKSIPEIIFEEQIAILSDSCKVFICEKADGSFSC